MDPSKVCRPTKRPGYTVQLGQSDAVYMEDDTPGRRSFGPRSPALYGKGGARAMHARGAGSDGSISSSPFRYHERHLSASQPIKETPRASMSARIDGARMLNQYVIEGILGSGAFGAVHQVQDTLTGTEYAMKEFSKSRLRRRIYLNASGSRRRGGGRGGRPGMVSRRSANDIHAAGAPTLAMESGLDLIRGEIAIMKKLSHPNIIRLVEALDDPDSDSIYIVLELCKKGVIMRCGPDIVAEPYTDGECRKYFRELLLGMEYLHAQGISHRDIKPENLLLTDDGVLKISDFGISEMFTKDLDDRMSKTPGSPAFLAPEFLSSHKAHVSGRRTDIWAMGVTLYCLRFGRLPFNYDNVIELYDSIRNDAVELPSDTDERFVDLMARILAKNPDERITMAELRQHPWVTDSGEEPLISPEDNRCLDPVTVSHSEMSSAFHNVRKFVAVLKAVSRLKGMRMRRHQDASNALPPGSASEAPPRGSTPVSSRSEDSTETEFSWRSLPMRTATLDLDAWTNSLLDLGRPTAHIDLPGDEDYASRSPGLWGSDRYGSGSDSAGNINSDGTTTPQRRHTLDEARNRPKDGEELQEEATTTHTDQKKSEAILLDMPMQQSPSLMAQVTDDGEITLNTSPLPSSPSPSAQ